MFRGLIDVGVAQAVGVKHLTRATCASDKATTVKVGMNIDEENEHDEECGRYQDKLFLLTVHFY